jgi:hypothetical protein
MKSGNLNFLEPYGPLWACNGTALPLLYLQGWLFNHFTLKKEAPWAFKISETYHSTRYDIPEESNRQHRRHSHKWTCDAKNSIFKHGACHLLTKRDVDSTFSTLYHIHTDNTMLMYHMQNPAGSKSLQVWPRHSVTTHPALQSVCQGI